MGEVMVDEERDFQKRVQRIGNLVNELESIADPAARTAARELVQSLMDLHGAAMERILEIVFQAGDAGALLIDELGQEPLVSSLLVLYGIHPEALETRVEHKLAQVRSKLYKMGAEAALVAVNDGEVRVKVRLQGHVCGSTRESVKAAVEEAMYEAAPDLKSLIVDGLDEPAASSFVGVEKLLEASDSSLARHQPLALGTDGMD